MAETPRHTADKSWRRRPLDGADRVLARVVRAKLRRWLRKPLLNTAINFGGLTLVLVLNRATGHLGGFSDLLHKYETFLIGMIAFLTLIIWRGVLIQWNERDLVVHDGGVTFRTARRYLSWVALDNIAGVDVRKSGRPLNLGMDHGIGLTLRNAEYRGRSGRAVKLLARWNKLVTGSHVIMPDVYDLDGEKLAAAISAAAGVVTGHVVPVRVVTSGGVSAPVARPLGTSATLYARPVVWPPPPVCVECGYDLRGLAHDAKCPECGESVRLSLEGPVLGIADPAWLLRLRLGAALLAMCGAATAALLFTCGRVAATLSASADPACYWRVVILVGGGTAIFTLFIAGFLLTSRRSTRSPTAHDPWLRRAARGSMLAPILAALAFAVIPNPVVHIFLVAVALIIPANFLLWHARELWKRVPSATGRMWTTLVASSYAMLTIAVIGFMLIGYIASTTMGPFPGPPATAPTTQAAASPPAMPSIVGLVIAFVLGAIPLPFAAVFVALCLAIPRHRPVPNRIDDPPDRCAAAR